MTDCDEKLLKKSTRPNSLPNSQNAAATVESNLQFLPTQSRNNQVEVRFQA